MIPWDAAPALILEALVEGVGAPARGGLIGVTGAVGSGKSTLARRLSACVISTDDYLPDYDEVEVHERDLPEFADLERLARDLESLRAGRPTAIPTWSFHTHRRAGERIVEPADLIVCEGLHALHERVADALDLGVFVEAPADVRWRRLEARERTGQRGWGVEETREFFHAVAEPTFHRLAPLYRARADFIVVNEEGE